MKAFSSIKTRSRLSELALHPAGGHDVIIAGLSTDAREIRQDFLFAALKGSNYHGAKFIAEAIEAGASAILTDSEGGKIAGQALQAFTGALVISDDPRQAVAYAAALWFGAQPECAVAVTGTNGKTSVASFTRQIWENLGLTAVNIGTNGIEGGFDGPVGLTTPDPITLHRYVAEMARSGVTHLAFEASSHGLAQRRSDGVRLAAAGFTNLSRDHLDYHASFEDYLNEKARLFEQILPADAPAVIFRDGMMGEEMLACAKATGREVLTVSHLQSADLQLVSQRLTSTKQTILFTFKGKRFQADLNLVGGFQAYNVLVAAGLALATGQEPEAVFGVVGRLKAVRGRMELAATRANGAAIFVDACHTPDGVLVALGALRPHMLGRLGIVLGAGGDRDCGKRPLMGKAAATAADFVIVTDDNPRNENPSKIRQAVLEGCPGALEVADRAAAILRGVDMLEPGDVLLVAGKGAETTQLIAGVSYPFEDQEQISLAVEALELRV